MKCRGTFKLAADQRSQVSCNAASPEKTMDRNTKLRASSGKTNIHQQSSPLSYRKYREIRYNIG